MPIPEPAGDGGPTSRQSTSHSSWPELPLQEWEDTYATLHMWTQIVGKVRLARAPMMNHWWQVVLYTTSHGLTTSPIPDGSQTFQIDFDFADHLLWIQTSRGARRSVALEARPVAEFYAEFMDGLRGLGIEADIWTMPQEVEEPIPFEQDRVHSTYEPEHAHRFWRVLAQSDRVMWDFRSRFIGKCSPVHFFWGAFDSAVTRFSGRPAPEHPGGVPHIADWVVREAYSHEVSSCGFWPGGGPVPEPIFYSYAYPEPDGFADYPIDTEGAYYHPELREFVLPYQVLREADDPDEVLLTFLQWTYEAAAELGAWDRAALERTSS